MADNQSDMSDVGIGPLNITRPERVGTLTVIVRMTGGGNTARGTEADARNLTDPVLSVIEGDLRETSMGKRDLDPVVWSEDYNVYVNTGARQFTEGTVERVVTAIQDAVDKAHPGVAGAVPPETGSVTIRSEYPLGK